MLDKNKLKKIKKLEILQEQAKKEEEKETKKILKLSSFDTTASSVKRVEIEDDEENESNEEIKNNGKYETIATTYKKPEYRKTVREKAQSIFKKSTTSTMGAIFGSGVILSVLILAVFSVIIRAIVMSATTVLIMPLSDKSDFAEYQEKYNELDNEFIANIEKYLQQDAVNPNARGETIKYGINGQNNEGELINDNYKNGLTISVLTDEKHKGIDSNIEDLVAMIAIMFGQRQTEFKKESLKVLEYLYDISHIFRFRESELYSCKNGCSIAEYYCNDYYNDYINCDLKYNPFLVTPYIKESTKSEVTRQTRKKNKIKSKNEEDEEDEETIEVLDYEIKKPTITCPVCEAVYKMNKESLYAQFSQLKDKGVYENVFNYDSIIFKKMYNYYCGQDLEANETPENAIKKINMSEISGCEKGDEECFHGEKYYKGSGENRELIDGHYLGKNKEQAVKMCPSYAAHWECNYSGENEQKHAETCEKSEIGCAGWYYCPGHSHPVCNGHQLACCMGHRDIVVDVKLRFFDELAMDINRYNFSADEKEANLFKSRYTGKQSNIIKKGKNKTETNEKEIVDTKDLIQYEDTLEYWNTLTEEEQEKLMEKEEKEREKAEKEEEKEAQKEEKRISLDD